MLSHCHLIHCYKNIYLATLKCVFCINMCFYRAKSCWQQHSVFYWWDYCHENIKKGAFISIAKFLYIIYDITSKWFLQCLMLLPLLITWKICRLTNHMKQTIVTWDCKISPVKLRVENQVRLSAWFKSSVLSLSLVSASHSKCHHLFLEELQCDSALDISMNSVCCEEAPTLSGWTWNNLLKIFPSMSHMWKVYPWVS